MVLLCSPWFYIVKYDLKLIFCRKSTLLESGPPVPIGFPAIFAVRNGQIGVAEKYQVRKVPDISKLIQKTQFSR